MTLPTKLRKALRIRPGDRIDFVLGEDGEVRLRVGDVDINELLGFLCRSGRATVSLEAMDDAILRRGEKP